MESASEAKRYSVIQYRLLLVDLISWFMFLGVFQAAGASSAASRLCSRLFDSELLSFMAYLCIFGGLYYLLKMPLRFYGGFLIEHRFGLSRLTALKWIVREAKRFAVSAVLSGVLLMGLFAVIRYQPVVWHLWATAGWVIFSVVLTRIFPTVLLPFFYKTTPVEDGALVGRIEALCKRIGLPALGVFRFNLGVETRKANAALVGLGSSRRVLLSDTLMSEFSAEEIESVIAHELGHQCHHHLSKLLAISAISTLVAFSLTAVVGEQWVGILRLEGLSDPSGFPILIMWLSILMLVGLPVQNAISRQFEWQADGFAIEATGLTPAFAAALRRLSKLNLSDPNPPLWAKLVFYDHPPIEERIQAAEAT